MMTRRALVLTGATGLAAAISHAALAKPASPPNDPVAIVNAIYARAAKGRGDGGGAFIIENQVAKTKYLSKSLVELWAKADAHTPKGDIEPVDFDPGHQLAGAECQIIQTGSGEARPRQGCDRRHHRRPGRAARQIRRQHHPLQPRPRRRTMEDRRYQRRQRRRSLVNSGDSDQLAEKLVIRANTRRSVPSQRKTGSRPSGHGPMACFPDQAPAAIARAGPGPDRSGPSPATAAGPPAAPLTRRDLYARIRSRPSPE